MIKQEKSKLILGFFAIIFIAVGSIVGCDDDGGGGGNPFNNADLVRGGLLYDRYWAVTGGEEPDDTNPTYPSEENAMVFPPDGRMGSQTWRCKECHGWDYLGDEGLYMFPNSHWTDIIGLLQVADNLRLLESGKNDLAQVSQGNGEFTPEELFDIIKFGIPGLMTGYEDQLSDDDIWDLVRFIVLGQQDYRDFVVYDFEGLIDIIEPFDLQNGASLYNSTCAGCHGIDGEGMGVSLNEVAIEAPPEFFHKVRFGQPGSNPPMPSAINNGWTDQQIKDVFAYAAEVLPNPPMPTPTPTPTASPTPTPTPTGTPAPTPTPVPLDGEALYNANCVGCHGVDGTGGIGPNIQGASASEIQNAIDMNFGPGMGALSFLTPAEIQAIADFLATF